MENLKRVVFPNMGKLEHGYDPLAHAKIKANSINETPGDLTGMDCPKCKNRGQIAYPKDNGTSDIYIEECSCITMRRCIWKMEKSGLRNVIRDCTFEKFEASQPWQEKAKKMAQEYAENPEGWFLACGQSGSGKTHLCTAICRELLLNGKQVVYMSWRQDVAELKAMSMDGDARGMKLDELKKAEYLYIDDLFKTGVNAEGVARPTVADIGLAFEIVNYRYINRLPTLFSSALLPEELLAIDEATAGRIVELAKGRTLAIGKDSRKNYRLKGVVML